MTQRHLFHARWKYPGARISPLSCGREPVPCPAHLGQAIRIPARDGSHPDRRVLDHKVGYRWDATQGAYRVVKGRTARDGTIIGRRALPQTPAAYDDLTRELLDIEGLKGKRGIIGPSPELPATIICPLCGLPNLVNPPPPVATSKNRDDAHKD